MRLMEMLGMQVVSASGDHVGHVIDLRCAGEPERGETRAHRVVTEVIVGRVGWLERMGFQAVRERIVPWAEIAEVGTERITLAGE
jgi:sporulation protein YlmC with PRC-barrel domain